ncbi:GCN5 family acetyltransferase [Chloroflexus islandicus]|uniref:GCN5 family acetyltransferase n=1 Tax=Chloroflexus islandicus TaxID=1707952 RepID=A0A178M6B7_9CHLR|nr:GNAT family N-acetyltransferase [Chloroflexus islandicus]OAN44292.1 GCN5 family acetyltransferase [Chloroflexus islandicus]
MFTYINIILLNPADPAWHRTIDQLWQQLGAPHNPDLLPPHFVKSTFPRMGGIVATIDANQRLVGVGLLFPRAIAADGTRSYTLRLHEFDQQLDDDLLRTAFHPVPVVIYRPRDGQTFAPPAPRPTGVWIGPPQADDLPAIAALYRAVWNSQPYPTDLFSAEFGPGTALVATVDGQLAGFLLGFFRFGGAPYPSDELAIESQVMAVDPVYRGHGLATRLKRAQARAALARGVRCIQWTVDPLQLPNALLNFNRLHAVAGAFVRGYYPVQNALNLVTASRFLITWLPASAHGRRGLVDGGERLALADLPGVAVLNDGPQPLPAPDDPPAIAIAIPPDWTALQHRDLALATAWRDATDALFAAWVGWEAGKYVIYAVARDTAGNHYLIGRPAGPWVWEE